MSGNYITMVTRDEFFRSQIKHSLNRIASAERKLVMSNHCVSNRTIAQIEEDLESDEEEVIKFACRDITTHSNVRDLLSQLNEGNSRPVVLELLYLLKRFDLIKKHFNLTKAQVENLLTKSSRVISDYRNLMIELNEQIEEPELNSLIFLLKDCLRKGGKLKNKTFLSLVVDLEKSQLISPSDLHLLQNALQTIHRVDLRNKVLKFLGKVNLVHEETRESLYHGTHPPTGSFHRHSSTSSVVPQLAGSRNKDAVPVQETQSQFGVEDERYPVRTENMGFCIIIDCVGNDAEMLQGLFRSLHFVVQCHRYKTIDEVEDILQDAANMEQHRNHDIFVCVIVSRGNADSLFCLDGNLPGLSLDRIKNIFTGQSCPGLRGKPKLFFIQNYFACDIEEAQGESLVEVDGPSEGSASRQQVQNLSRIPNEADIFWSHCRVDELELQRSSGSASLYLQSLRDLLTEKETRKHRDLLDIHTELNRIIYTKKTGYSLQLRHTFTKKLFLYPA